MTTIVIVDSHSSGTAVMINNITTSVVVLPLNAKASHSSGIAILLSIKL